MRKNKLITLACLFLSCFGFVKGNAFSLNSVSEALKPIIIIRHGDQSAGAPRSLPAEITAEYDDVLCSVVVSLANAGASVDVTIENLSTGENYSDTVPGNSLSVFPISGSAGSWVITFTPSSGDVYEGKFEL